MQTIKNKLLSIQGFKKETFTRATLSKSLLLGLAFTALSHNDAKAQFTLTGQVRPN